MWDVIEQLKPPGYKKKNRGAIYRLIARVAGRMAADGQKALEAFFPLTATTAMVRLHGESMNIPEFPFDTDDTYQERVASAAFYLERQGMRGFVTEFLDQLVPGRYRVLEYPTIGFRIGYSPLGYSPLGGGSRIFVKVRGITDQEEGWIFTFLDTSLDPDIEIYVVPWVFNPVTPAGVSLIRRLGGSRWIKSKLEDICAVVVEFLPDDGMRVGYTGLGRARLIAGTDPLVIVKAEKEEYISEILSRLDDVLDDSIERRCF